MRSSDRGRVGVVGLGHIGGSLVGRLALRGWAVAGYDEDPSAVRVLAERYGIEDAGSLPRLAATCSVIVLACPTPVVPALVAEVRARGFSGTLAEVASVKGRVLEVHGVERLVSLHPMAGRESGGASSADPSIFEGARWAIVVRGDESRDALLEAIQLVTEGVGNEVLGVDAQVHDRVMAVVTALPHVTAILLARALERLPEAAVAAALAAGSLRDGMRVARTPPERLVELLWPNAAELGVELDRLLADGSALRAHLDSYDDLMAFVEPAARGAWRVVERPRPRRRVQLEFDRLPAALVSWGREGWCIDEVVEDVAGWTAVLTPVTSTRQC